MSAKLYIIAGPNGAGKTTFAGDFLPVFTTSREFVNADAITLQFAPTNPETVAFRAGREMLRQIRTLAGQRVDFAIETTLSGKAYFPWLRNLKTSGYEIHLYFLWLPNVQLSMMRVADRVRKGGHNIPEAVIRRRYISGIKNLFHFYRPLLDSWSLFDNSPKSPYLIARETNKNLVVWDALLFAECFKMAANPTDETLKESAEAPDWMDALTALRMAKARVIEEHYKSGHPLIIWHNGKIYLQPPEEAKRELEEAIRSGAWPSITTSLR